MDTNIAEESAASIVRLKEAPEDEAFGPSEFGNYFPNYTA
jgi:hypothetical protein